MHESHVNIQHASYFPKYSPRLPNTISTANSVLPALFRWLDYMTVDYPLIISRHRPQHGMRWSDNRHILAIMEELHDKRKF